MDNNDLRPLADRLAELIGSGLGQRSRWALSTALEAADTDGLAGVLVITIPPKSKDRLDISFTVGTVDVISRWGGVA